MPRFYCLGCWHDLHENYELCPDCGFNIIEFYSKSDYVEKLIRAFKSPGSGIPVRAVMLPGRT